MSARLLDDGQMRDFVRNGYILVQPELPPEFHREMFSRVDSVFETEGNPGNNLMARIPAVQEVFCCQSAKVGQIGTELLG